MALIPSFFHIDPWEARLNSLLDRDHFGLGVVPDEIRALAEFPQMMSQMKISPRMEGELQHTTFGKDGFQACIDAKHFKPSEITVKTIDNTIVIEGKHDERKDRHGHVMRQFTRKYVLPDDYDPNEVVSSLSSDGILTVKAPAPKATPEGVKEKVIPIQHTGPAHLHIK